MKTRRSKPPKKKRFWNDEVSGGELSADVFDVAHPPGFEKGKKPKKTSAKN